MKEYDAKFAIDSFKSTMSDCKKINADIKKDVLKRIVESFEHNFNEIIKHTMQVKNLILKSNCDIVEIIDGDSYNRKIFLKRFNDSNNEDYDLICNRYGELVPDEFYQKDRVLTLVFKGE